MQITSELPTEVLFHIFSFFPTPSDQDIDDFDAQWRLFRLICLRWRDVADMFIYSHLKMRIMFFETGVMSETNGPTTTLLEIPPFFYL